MELTTQDLIDEKAREHWNLCKRFNLIRWNGESTEEINARIGALSEENQHLLFSIEIEIECLHEILVEETRDYQMERMRDDMEDTYDSMRGEL
jgi:hypothetical protein